MHGILLALLASFIGFSASSPLEPRTGCTPKARSLVDNFDQHVQVVPVGAADPIGDTAGGLIGYNSFNYADKSLGAFLEAPPSPPNVASFTVTAELKSGQPYFRGINSTVKYLDLKSVFYSCQVMNGQGSVSVTQTCTIQVAGVKYDTGATVVQELQFDPSLLPVGVQFASTSFPDTFRGLKNVTIQEVQGLTPQQLAVVSFDNVAYTAYTC